MRPPRILPDDDHVVYHCTSHIVLGLPFFNHHEKTKFTSCMRRLAAFTGMEIVTHSVMSNHFHIVVRPPKPSERSFLTDDQLLVKLKRFYGPQSLKVKTFRDSMKLGGRLHAELRKQYLRRMGNLSIFMQELKEGFSKWYNKRHERWGTLWASRFKHNIVEDNGEHVLAVCAYVDLNAVRAGMVDDPARYPFCGYAEAVVGVAEARAGLASVLKGRDWKEQSAGYRVLLYLKAGSTSKANRRALDPEEIAKVLETGGELEMCQLLRLRLRRMTDGAVFGSKEFVERIWKKHFKKHTKGRKTGARRIPGKGWKGFYTLRNLQKDDVGVAAVDGQR